MFWVFARAVAMWLLTGLSQKSPYKAWWYSCYKSDCFEELHTSPLSFMSVNTNNSNSDAWLTAASTANRHVIITEHIQHVNEFTFTNGFIFQPQEACILNHLFCTSGCNCFLDEVAVVLYRLQLFAWQWQKAFYPVSVIAAICNTDARLVTGLGVSDDQRQHK